MATYDADQVELRIGGRPTRIGPDGFLVFDRERERDERAAVSPPPAPAPDELTDPPFRSPHSLWLEAGGDRERYIALMKLHGNLVDITDEDAGTVH